LIIYFFVLFIVFDLIVGKQFSMEKAPWKLTHDLVELMNVHCSSEPERKLADGEKPTPIPIAVLLEAPMFKYYLQLCTDCLALARRHGDDVSSLMSIMSHQSQYPAFKYSSTVIRDFKARLLPEVGDDKLAGAVKEMMVRSYEHAGTLLYDQFQVMTNGIKA
jgi:phosphatidylinositol kinase/protein kinase (PI-3  family)